jgi:hypothetical protein
MSRYTNVRVNISEGQIAKIKKALDAGVDSVSIRLTHGDFSGEHVLAVTRAQFNKMEKACRDGKGTTIRMSKTQLKYNAKIEGGFIGALLPLLATAGKFLLSNVLPSLATGALTGLGSAATTKIIDKISGSAIYVKKGGTTCKMVPQGAGLYLKPWPGSGLNGVGDGIYMKTGNGLYMKTGKGLILGPNSPFRDIPILGWLL